MLAWVLLQLLEKIITGKSPFYNISKLGPPPVIAHACYTKFGHAWAIGES